RRDLGDVVVVRRALGRSEVLYCDLVALSTAEGEDPLGGVAEGRDEADRPDAEGPALGMAAAGVSDGESEPYGLFFGDWHAFIGGIIRETALADLLPIVRSIAVRVGVVGITS